MIKRNSVFYTAYFLIKNRNCDYLLDCCVNRSSPALIDNCLFLKKVFEFNTAYHHPAALGYGDIY